MKRITSPLGLVIGACLLMAVSCNKDTVDPVDDMGVFELNIIPIVSAQVFEKEVVFQNAQGRDYFLSELKMYLSQISLTDADGKELSLSEIELFDLTQPGANKTQHGLGTYATFDVPAGDYQGLTFSIGVPEDLNHADPSDFGSDHPLSTFNGMHWAWASGYRFMVVEGRIDSSANADGSALAKPIAYHTGLDTLLRTLNYTEPEHHFTVSANEETRFVLELDVNRLFFMENDTIDMVANPGTHTLPPGSPAFLLSEKITRNLVNNALFKVPF